jgi:hypothetical protein
MSRHARDRIGQAWPLLLAIGLPLAAALLVGGDSSWDLRNYHLYDPHSLLSGRAAIDIAPAQLQSWHNPLLDLPLLLLVMSGLPMRAINLWLALPTMLSLVALLRLQSLLCSGGRTPAPPTLASRVVLVVLALSGAATWSTFATSTGDPYVGAGMLASLWIALAAGRGDAAWRQWLLAGLVAGATVGLKLSCGFYCIALAAAALAAGPLPGATRRVGGLFAGGVLGFALAYGAWAVHLHASTGNPVFPYFNQWFQSADATFASHADARFRPASVIDALLAPVRLLRNSQLFSELKLRDPRLLLAIATLPMLAWRAGRATVAAEHGAPPAELAAAARLRALAAFVLVAVVAWLAQSGIYRYAIALELLGALGVVLLAQSFPRGRGAMLLLALLLVSADTRRPHWGRDASPVPLARLQAPALGEDAMVLTATDDPLAYLALGLPRDVPLVATANNLMDPAHCTGLQLRASARVAAHAGPLWLLEDPTSAAGSAARTMLRERYALAVGNACQDYPNPLAQARLCPLARVGPPTAPCLSQAR